MGILFLTAEHTVKTCQSGVYDDFSILNFVKKKKTIMYIRMDNFIVCKCISEVDTSVISYSLIT